MQQAGDSLAGRSERYLGLVVPTADPKVIAVDDANRDTIGIRELNDSAQFFQGSPDQAPSQRITVPVLLLAGDNDRLFCAPDAFKPSTAPIRRRSSSSSRATTRPRHTCGW